MHLQKKPLTCKGGKICQLNLHREGKVCIPALLTQHIRFHFNVFSCICHLTPSAASSLEHLFQLRW